VNRERIADIRVLFCRDRVDSDVRRREVLVALGGSLATAGCASLLGGDAEETETLTPAPVPTTARDTGGTSEGDTSQGTAPDRRTADGIPCPELPANADRYVCSGTTAGDGLGLVPEASTYDVGTGGFEFTLSNRLSLPFRTGRDRWTLGHRTAEGWSIVARGAGADLRTVEPGGSFVWVLGGDGNPDATRLDVDVGGGQHALAVTGALPRGALTAVIAPFRIEPSIA